MRMFQMLAFAGGIGMALPATAQGVSFTIGTGGPTGVYFVVGQSICRFVNRGAAAHGLNCNAPLTGGTIANINAIKTGEMHMGVAQSDWQHHAFNGTSHFEGKQVSSLRAMFSVHSEPFNVITRKDSGIETFDDLKGKRVNIGDVGSGQRATTEVVLAAKGWTLGDFAAVSELGPTEQATALGNHEVDAIIYTVGHPNVSIEEAFATIDAALVAVGGPEIDKLVGDNTFYQNTTVPGGLYDGADTDVPTFGVKATIVTSAEVKDEVVYQVVKAVFDNFDRFKGLHPALKNLTEAEMISSGLSAPLHTGAIKYYKEKGWMD